MTKIEEIYEAVLPEMDANKIEDTTENRLIFLEGLYRDGKKIVISVLKKLFIRWHYFRRSCD